MKLLRILAFAAVMTAMVALVRCAVCDERECGYFDVESKDIRR